VRIAAHPRVLDLLGRDDLVRALALDARRHLETARQPEAADDGELDADPEPDSSLVERDELVEDSDGPGHQADESDDAEADVASDLLVVIRPQEEGDAEQGYADEGNARDQVRLTGQQALEKVVNVHVL